MHILTCFFQDGFKCKKTILLSRLLVVILALVTSYAFAQDVSIEYKIRAGYLYNFTKFITWPANDSSSFNVCIVGKDPFGNVITPMETRTVKNKPIRVKVFNSFKKTNQCQLIYSERVNKEKPSIPILTVGESKRFVEHGGMIAFFLQDGKIKLYINVAVLRTSGLKISAKLLEVSELYEEQSND